MRSKTGSKPQSRRAVKSVAVVTHGHPETTAPALDRLRGLARERGIELVFAADEAGKHRLDGAHGDPSRADLVLVLGGDGTMLRAFHRFLGTGVPVLGVNFGRVGFLTSIRADALEHGLERVLGGEFEVLDLATLEVVSGRDRWAAVNDVVCTSSKPGRMVELAWAVGGDDLGTLPCDGLICCTPTGSTAYNLSNGGPVLAWGLEAMAVTFVAPHSLHARPLVVPRGGELAVWNRTRDTNVTVIVDGRPVAELGRDGQVSAQIGNARCSLAMLPEMSFFRRYRETFAS